MRAKSPKKCKCKIWACTIECRDKEKQGEARKSSLRGCRARRSYKKPFLRECRAYSEKSTLIPPKYKAKHEKSTWYRRNRRRRSSKDVPKGMQNLQWKVSADTPKNKWWSRKINGKEIVYSTMGVWVCVFDINIISHNITSSHHFA